MATAEFSKFAGILSAALLQYHLSGFETAPTGIPSPPLALFVVMLSKAYLTSQSRISAVGEGPHHGGYLGHYDLFWLVLLCILATSS